MPMGSGSADRAALLQDDIRVEIERIDRQRRSNRRQAFALRITVVLASATTTVLLGFKAGGGLGVAFTDAALVLSATATVMVAWDAFYNPRALWIMEVSHLARLQRLERRFADQHARAGGDLTEDQLDGLRSDFEALMTAHLTAWTSLREQQSPSPGALDRTPPGEVVREPPTGGTASPPADAGPDPAERMA